MNAKCLTQAVVMIAMLVISAVVSAVVAQSVATSWREYGFAATEILVYDFDNDSVDEILLLPNYVIDNYAVLESPYVHYPHGLIADVDLDGNYELVLYNDDGHYVVYKNLQKIAEFDLGIGKPVIDFTRRIIVVGNKALYNMTVYTFRGSPVYPVATWGRIYAVYTCSDGICVEDSATGRVSVVYGKPMNVLGAYISHPTLYILASTSNSTALLVYSMSNNSLIKVVGFTEPVSRVLSVTYTYGAPEFIVEGVDGVYKLSESGIVLVAFGSVLYYDYSYIYVYAGAGIVNVIQTATQYTIAKLKLPESRLPDLFGGRYPYLGCVYGNKTYILMLVPEPYAYISIPYTAVVGEKVYYKLYTYGANVASLLVNGTPVPTEGYIVFNASGVYVFTAYVSNGATMKSVSATIRVDPRPLSISFRAVDTPTAFDTGTAVVEVYDGISSKRVEDVPCNVTVGGLTFSVLPWSEFQLKYVPESGNLVQVRIVCGDGVRYALSEHRVTITLQPAVANIKVDYPSPSTLVISAVFNGTEIPGSAYIYVDRELVARGNLPYTLTLKPGNHTVIVEFIPAVSLFKPAKYVISVSYYANISDVPPEIRTSVLVADRVEIVNNTVVQTETVTVPKPVYIEKRTPDITLTAIAGIACGAGGFVAGVFLKRKKGAAGSGRELEKEYAEFEAAVETEKA